MGLFIKTRRIPSVIPLNDAMRRRAVEAVTLLAPFMDHAEKAHVGIYRYAPIPLKNEFHVEKTIEFGVSGRARRVEVLKNHIDALLRNIVLKKIGTLYETYIVVKVYYKPPGLDAPIIVYLMVSNGSMLPADIELEVYEWVRGNEVVETLEETLEILGGPSLEELMARIGALARNLHSYGYTVERAVAGPLADALDDMTLAHMYWLPSEAKILSVAIDTVYSRREVDEEAAEIYDYLAPHRKDLIVNMVARRSEFKLYLASIETSGIARAIPAGSVILKPLSTKTLEPLYSDIVSSILKPMAGEVLVERLSDIQARAERVLPSLLRKRAGKRG